MNNSSRSYRLLSTAFVTLGLLCMSAAPALAKGKGKKHRKKHAKIMAKLDLSDAQKAEFKALRNEFRQQKRAIHQDTSLSKAQKKEALYTLRKSKKSKLSALLSSRQKQEHKALRDAHRAKKRSKRLVRLTKKLDLSSSQQARVSDILDQAAKRGQGIHSQDNLSFQEHKAKVKAHRKATRNELQSVLNEEQKEKFATMKKKRRAKNKRRGKRRGKRNLAE